MFKSKVPLTGDKLLVKRQKVIQIWNKQQTYLNRFYIFDSMMYELIT